ncbi:hypothetical protein CHLRE_17g717700v5 [Chlamydomonas reinhardtii]|uniref:Uncharacterized protein n=1 Tax=Chlamydomonas reinhardtii TaxID=3055 RepID=A0A2K3CQ35_CHLRE|nr:uncharacterized protein CHLRE_17g717700v5 [Chlamydomonas reinhardtii]PNW70385.1 hypothetical protein CHLRE_17g717700v5 [Chlamydomonas reinhardtii]
MSKLDKFLALPEDDSDSDDSEHSKSEQEAEEQEEEEEEAQAKGPAKKKAAIKLEDLERAGYKSGPSVLYVKPPAETGEQNWNWGSGREAKEKGEDSDEDRGATRAAVQGVEASAAIAVKAMAQQAALREGARQERLEAKMERIAQEKKALTFNQKEKRKRDEGKTSRAKNCE